MPTTTEVDPVSDILRTAGRLGLAFQPEDLPESAFWLYQAIDDGLMPRLGVQPGAGEAGRRRVALDTAISLCAEHAGERFVPSGLALKGRGSPRPFCTATRRMASLPTSCPVR